MESFGTCADGGRLNLCGGAAACGQLPGRVGQLKAVVTQVIHGRHTNGRRPECAVVGLIRRTYPGVNCVGGAPDPVGGICGVGIGTASGVVKGIVGQDIVIAS